MSQIDEMQESVQHILDSMNKSIEQVRSVPWTPKDGLLPIVMRSIMCRQFDALGVISRLVADGMGYATGPMLRPSCEERIWTSYLLGIPPDLAEALLLSMSHQEIATSLQVQDRIAGRPVTEYLGLLPYLETSKRSKTEISNRLRTLAIRLEWPTRCRREGSLPSMRWLAKKVDLLDVYDLIYHGTSRFVHFKVHELLRSVWGNPKSGQVSIQPMHMEAYRSHFSLYWGLSLFIGTAIPILEFAKDSFGFNQEQDDGETVLAAAEKIGKLGRVPIITAQELAWSDNI